MDYNKLLEKARKVYAECVTNAEKRKLESVFPELAESDDEKIKRAIIKFVKENKDFPKDWVAWLEKQGEQNPTNKVEPKFKVGDWVVENITNGIFVGKITSINTCFYGVDGLDGNWYHIDFFEEEQMHLWTIRDAKDGDVLTSHECLVLFKNIDGFNIKCYCTYHSLNNPRFYVDTLQNKNAFHPTTKEQRNLLFSKMKEAGYIWDAEKKELKKIEW